MAQTKSVHTKTTAVQIGPQYYYQSNQISIKRLWQLPDFTELHCFVNIIVCYGILACLNILKGCPFINFIFASEDLSCLRFLM